MCEKMMHTLNLVVHSSWFHWFATFTWVLGGRQFEAAFTSTQVAVELRVKKWAQMQKENFFSSIMNAKGRIKNEFTNYSRPEKDESCRFLHLIFILKWLPAISTTVFQNSEKIEIPKHFFYYRIMSQQFLGSFKVFS